MLRRVIGDESFFLSVLEKCENPNTKADFGHDSSSNIFHASDGNILGRSHDFERHRLLYEKPRKTDGRLETFETNPTFPFLGSHPPTQYPISNAFIDNEETFDSSTRTRWPVPSAQGRISIPRAAGRNPQPDILISGTGCETGGYPQTRCFLSIQYRHLIGEPPDRGRSCRHPLPRPGADAAAQFLGSRGERIPKFPGCSPPFQENQTRDLGVQVR